MEIEVDYNPIPSKNFFISVGLKEKEAISFDYTLKGHRIIKQVLVEKKPFPKDKKPTAEWEALVLKEGKLIKKYHVRWVDLNEKDWVNDEIWETVWERPLSEELKNKFLYYSCLISDNYKNLDKIQREIKNFEEFLKKEIKKWL